MPIKFLRSSSHLPSRAPSRMSWTARHTSSGPRPDDRRFHAIRTATQAGSIPGRLRRCQTLRLPFRPPLDWEAMLGYFKAQAIRGVERVSDGVYRRTALVDGDPGVIELTLGGADHVLLRTHLPHWNGLIHVVRRARRPSAWTGIRKAQPERWAPILSSGPSSAPVPGFVRPERGTRSRPAFEPSSAKGSASAGRTPSRPARGTLRHARSGAAGPGSHPFVPAPSALAFADLTGLGLSARRTAAVSAFARAVADSTVTLDRTVPLDRLVTSISAIPGLGASSAHYLA